jgi:hypothetical protein
MPIHDHHPAFRGRAFFWGGIGLGLLLVASLLTHKFGLMAGSAKVAEGPAWMERQGSKIVIPVDSPLRSRLTVAPASADSVSLRLTLPAMGDSDPARTASAQWNLHWRPI